MTADADTWPALDWASWEPTATTLHMWTQIVGKVRLALSPPQAHWWNIPLYITARACHLCHADSSHRQPDLAKWDRAALERRS